MPQFTFTWMSALAVFTVFCLAAMGWYVGSWVTNKLLKR